jgi:hypothetical protein
MSTDGKILIIGKLNFAADNLSITGRLYADLSKIASGEATVLFLADIPEQVQLLSIEGRFKMGFRNPNTGEEAFFTVVDPKTGKPYARLAGPADGGQMGRATLTGRGYIIVDIPVGPSGAALNEAVRRHGDAGQHPGADACRREVLVLGDRRCRLLGHPEPDLAQGGLVLYGG